MRGLHFDRNLLTTFSRKLTVVLAMSGLMAVNLGPLEAKASDTLVSCSGGGSFTVSDNGAGEVFARDVSRTCAGTAVIPEGVTRIGLFQTQIILRIEIPASVRSIDGFAFANSSLAEVEIATGSNLTTIPGYAFYRTQLTSFQVPQGVTSIDDEAFASCGSLTSLTFEPGNQLQSVGNGAFDGAGLTSLTLPESVTSIGAFAFTNNTSLTSVSFGANSQLTTIGREAFAGTALTSFAVGSRVESFNLQMVPANTTLNIDSNNPNLALVDGVLFGGGMTKLLNYPAGLTASSYVIPSTVTEIATNAFRSAQLTSVTIPANVTSIKQSAFEGRSAITSVTFAPNSQLRVIESRAFQSTGLSSIVIPASVTEIGDYAFANCRSLATASIAANSQLTVLPEAVFVGTALTEFLVPSTIRTISRLAFAEAPLTSLTFEPNSRLEYIGAYAFLGNRLTSVQIPSGIQSIGEYAFVKFGLESLTLTLPTSPGRAGFEFVSWSDTSDGSLISYQDATDAVIYGVALSSVWTAEVSISPGGQTNSLVVTIPVGLTEAEMPATASLPRVKLAFAASNASATATVVPIANPAAASATPFMVTNTTKIVDIQVSGITGPVTVCLDGASTDDIFHFTGGAWVSLPNRTYVNGQVCGVTTNFSPFAAAALRPAPTSTLQRPVAALPVPVFEMGSSLTVLDKGQRLTLQGKRLDDIDSITVGGKEARIIEKAAGEVVIDVPASAEGFPEVVVLHKNGTVSIQGWMQVVAPYALTRSIKITRFVGDRPTLAGIAALERTFLAGPTANIVTCIMTVAVDASAAEVAKAEMRTRKACQRVVQLSARIKTTDVRVSRSGEPGSKPVLAVTFDRTLSGN